MKKEQKSLSLKDLEPVQLEKRTDEMLMAIAETVFTKEYWEQKIISFGGKFNGKNKGRILLEVFEEYEKTLDEKDRLNRTNGRIKMNQRNVAKILGVAQPTILRWLKETGIQSKSGAEETMTTEQKAEVLADRLTAKQTVILYALSQGVEHRMKSEDKGKRDLDAYAKLTEEERQAWLDKKKAEQEALRAKKRKYRKKKKDEEKQAETQATIAKNNKLIDLASDFGEGNSEDLKGLKDWVLKVILGKVEARSKKGRFCEFDKFDSLATNNVPKAYIGGIEQYASEIGIEGDWNNEIGTSFTMMLDDEMKKTVANSIEHANKKAEKVLEEKAKKQKGGN